VRPTIGRRIWALSSMIQLESCAIADRQVTVFERRFDRSRLYFENGTLYSHVGPLGHNQLDYVGAMAALFRSTREVLLLGTAGGALATMLSRQRSRVTAVDDFSPAFALAKKWFHLPDDVECVCADAWAFLRASDRRWGGIAVDLFRGNEIPAPFLTPAFAERLVDSVAARGPIVWNVADAPDSEATREVLEMLRAAGLRARALSVVSPTVGNTIIVGKRA
jgi:spermidine synthase